MTTPTKEQVAALLVGWQKLERARAAARMKAERSAQRKLSTAVSTHISIVSDKVSPLTSSGRFSKGLALAAIHGAAGSMRIDASNAIVSGRSDARDASRARAAVEIDHLADLLRRDGWDGDDLPGEPEPGDDSADYVAADAAASSLASRWQTAALAAILTWEDKGGTSSLSAEIRRTSAFLQPAIERTAATETSVAWSDEHDAALEPLSDYPWSAQVFKVWSAMLDGAICQRCYECDGMAVPVDAAWKDGAYQPMHPHCRCMEVPLYIPKPKALADVASDYAAYKAEVRDQVRASRHSKAAGRHAADFTARSRAGRSPVVISKDFAVGRLSSGRTAVGRLARRTGT